MNKPYKSLVSLSFLPDTRSDADPCPRQQRNWDTALSTNPASFGLASDFLTNSPLSEPIVYPSVNDNSSLAEALQADSDLHENAALAARLRKVEAWAKLGWETRPDGFPITNLTAQECKSYSPECRHTYRDTFLAWDFLVDLEAVGAKVRVADRWDMRERALEESLGVGRDDIVSCERHLGPSLVSTVLTDSMPPHTVRDPR